MLSTSGPSSLLSRCFGSISAAPSSVAFPAGCRICDAPLTSARRLPICDNCLDGFAKIPPESCDFCGCPGTFDSEFPHAVFLLPRLPEPAVRISDCPQLRVVRGANHAPSGPCVRAHRAHERAFDWRTSGALAGSSGETFTSPGRTLGSCTWRFCNAFRRSS